MKILKLEEFAMKIVWILFMIFILYLLLGSIFSTSYIGEYECILPTTGLNEVYYDHTFFVRDAWGIHIIVFVVFSIWAIYGKCQLKRYTRESVCVIVTILAIVIAVCANKYPSADQLKVMEIAAAFNNGDYSAFSTGEYLYYYPFQYGIVLFYQALSLIFGANNYLMFQMVNALLIGVTYWCLMQIWKRINVNGEQENNAIGFRIAFLFTPYLFYVVLIYGNVVGFLLSILSVYLL